MIKISLDNEGFNKKPDSSRVSVINNRIHNEEVMINLKGFVKRVINGHTWSGATFNGSRSVNNWKSQQIWSLDVDNEGKDLLLPSDIVNKGKLIGLEPNLIYYSFSSTIEKPKFRVVFIFETQVTDKKFAKAIAQYITDYFSEGIDSIDRGSSKDIARLFFGSTNDSIYSINENLIPIELFEGLQVDDTINSNEVKRSGGETLTDFLKEMSYNEVEDFQKLFNVIKSALSNPHKPRKNRPKDLRKGSRYLTLFSCIDFLIKTTPIEISEVLTTELVLTIISSYPKVWSDWDRDPEEMINVFYRRVKSYENRY